MRLLHTRLREYSAHQVQICQGVLLSSAVMIHQRIVELERPDCGEARC